MSAPASTTPEVAQIRALLLKIARSYLDKQAAVPDQSTTAAEESAEEEVDGTDQSPAV